MGTKRRGGLSRRRFLAGAGLGILGAGAVGCGEDSLRPAGELEALVVGSGFGGAVAALRLGQAGVPTTVLERGLAWPVSDQHDTFTATLNPDWRSTWLRDRTVAPMGPSFRIDRGLGVLAREEFDHMQVYTGAGVGGGSLVYGCMTVPPTRSIFERVFGSMVSFNDMEQQWLPRVMAMLDASPVPQEVLDQPFYAMSRYFIATCREAGVPTRLIDLATDWEAISAEVRGTVPAAATVGELLYGGNSGYKNSLDRNYLPAAVATGFVTIETQMDVVAVHRGPRGTWAVDVRHMDGSGETVREETRTCDLLVLAAGSLGTTKLLLQLQREGGLPGLGDALGGGWGANGNTMFMRSDLDQPTGDMQANPPVVAAFDLDNPHAAIVVENAPFPIGSDCACLLQLAVSDDPQRGRLELDARGDSLQLEWPEHSHAATVEAVQDFARRMSQRDGGRLGHGWLPDVTRNFTYHPLGGAPMGEVCDSWGRVHGAPGLAVVDGALIPGNTACSNPSLTIAAVAERAMDTLVREELPRLRRA